MRRIIWEKSSQVEKLAFYKITTDEYGKKKKQIDIFIEDAEEELKKIEQSISSMLKTKKRMSLVIVKLGTRSFTKIQFQNGRLLTDSILKNVFLI